MSNTLAVAAVTSTIRYLLERALGGSQPGPVGGARVTTLRPDQLNGGGDGDVAKGINVYLYQVTPNHAWNLTDVPTRRPDGSLACRPTTAIDLHYLLTLYGEDAELDSQRLLGRTVLALATNALLTRDLVAAAVGAYGDDTATSFLSAADLASQVELVKLSPSVLSLEEVSRLWGVLGTPYLLSVTYTATVVLLEAEIAPVSALPVRQRVVEVAPVSAPRIADAAPDPPGSPVVIGTALHIRGSGLRGRLTTVAIGPAELDPGQEATSAHLEVTVGDAVPAGVHAVQVVHRSPAGEAGLPPARVVARSNAVPVLVRPTVTVAGADADAVRLTATPALHPGQRVTVTMRRLTAGEPGALSFTLAPLPAGAPPSPDVVLAREDVPDGDWLVRITVDGAESLPELDGETYSQPKLSLP